MKLLYATDVRSAAIIGCIGTRADWLTREHQDATGLATAEELLARVLGSDQRRPPEVTR